jgi:hypothetical protein
LRTDEFADRTMERLAEEDHQGSELVWRIF